MHVLTNGVPVTEDLNPATELLLRGLLARDRRQRWHWKEVQAWLAGETVAAPEAATRAEDVDVRTSISLSGEQCRSAASFALAAPEAANWHQAKDLLLRGAVANWTCRASFE